MLKLNSKKAKQKLNWTNKLTFSQTIEMTTMWYKNYKKKNTDIVKFSSSQISGYEKKL